MRVLVLLVLAGLVGAFFHFREPAAPPLHVDDPRHSTGDGRVVMLAAEWCGYCIRQRAEFERAGVRYRLLDVDTPEGDRAMQALGARGVPVTIVGQRVIRGFDPDALDQSLSPLGYRVFAR